MLKRTQFADASTSTTHCIIRPGVVDHELIDLDLYIFAQILASCHYLVPLKELAH
jgi:hypothetical protein